MTSNRTSVHAGPVSKALAAKHARSTSHGGMVRGYRSVRAGFQVTVPKDERLVGEVVFVDHVGASGVRRLTDAEHVEQHNARIAAYAETLRAAGYQTEEITGDGVATSVASRCHRLRVTAPTD